jgi:hypothetical protein
MSNPSEEVQEAAHSDDPNAGQEGSTDKRDVEHERLVQNQAEDKTEPPPDEPGPTEPEAKEPEETEPEAKDGPEEQPSA